MKAFATFVLGIYAGVIIDRASTLASITTEQWVKTGLTLVTIATGFGVAIWQAENIQKRRLVGKAKTIKEITRAAVNACNAAITEITAVRGGNGRFYGGGQPDPAGIRATSKAFTEITMDKLPHELVMPTFCLQQSLNIFMTSMNVEYQRLVAGQPIMGVDELSVMRESLSKIGEYDAQIEDILGKYQKKPIWN